MNDPIELAISLAEGPFSVKEIHEIVNDPLIILKRAQEHIQRLAGNKDRSSSRPYNDGKPAIEVTGRSLWRRTEEGDRMAARMIAEYVDSDAPPPPCCVEIVAKSRDRRKSVHQIEAADLAEPRLPDRKSITVRRIIRDTALVLGIKAKHGYRCQLCDTALTLADGQPYAEAHHLQPLGSEHQGPDINGNIIVVCPNCHVLLDLGAIRLDERTLRRLSLHGPSRKYIDYHNTRVFRG